MTKRRGRRRSKRDDREPRDSEARRRADPRVRSALSRAERWIDRDQPERARDLLEPLVRSEPSDPDFYYTLAYARLRMGAFWEGVRAFEEAAERSDEVKYLLPLSRIYLQAGLPIHALRVFRRLDERRVPGHFLENVRQARTSVQRHLAQVTQQLDRPQDQVEEGLYQLELGQRALDEQDFRGSITANRRAIRHLGDWPPPRNNLAQALFYGGRPKAAMEEVRAVLDDHPRNLQALANGVRFLGWSGREAEARELWDRLEDVPPRDARERLKKAEAAAALREHESVYRTLRPVDEAAVERGELTPPLLSRAQYFLAAAEANTGRRRQAEQRLVVLQDAAPLAWETLDALRAGKSGTGWADHFRYVHLLEMLPRPCLNELMALIAPGDDVPPERQRRRMRRFANRYPQIVRVGEKTIWEEQEPEAGIDILRAAGTPQAYDVLRRFGTSQAGDDHARFEALNALVEAGEIDEGEPVRVWMDGAWREVEVRLEEIPREAMRQSDYAPCVIDVLNRGLLAERRGETERAEELFERVLELDPNVKEAYNNLGAIYTRRGEHRRAKEMFRKAVAIDPTYVFPLCNLANYMVEEDRLDEAEELLEPLQGAEGLLPPEEVFYDVTRARLLMQRGSYTGARQLLEDALALRPEHEQAREMLATMRGVVAVRDMIEGFGDHVRAFHEKQQERDRAWRERLQEALNTLEPTLAEALPLYTRKSLTEMGHIAMPWGGWSTLRKAELVEALIDALTDPENLARMVEELSEEEREALRTVMDRGGAMPWGAFDARYGNDLEETRYWQHHLPESIMGRLRLHGLLVEATVDGEVYILVPSDLREDLQSIL